MGVGGEAAARGEIEAPMVHPALEDAVFELTEPRQVRLQVGAAALHHEVPDPHEIVRLVLLGVPALGVLEPLRRQALEEGVDELVVGAPAGRPEAERQEQAVHPVDLVAGHLSLHELPGDDEAVAALLAGVRTDLPADEVDDDPLDALLRPRCQLEQHEVADAGADLVGQREQRLPPLPQGLDEIAVIWRPRRPAPPRWSPAWRAA